MLWEWTEWSSQSNSLEVVFFCHPCLEGELSNEGKEMKTSKQRVWFTFCGFVVVVVVSFKFEFNKHSYPMCLTLSFKFLKNMIRTT